MVEAFEVGISLALDDGIVSQIEKAEQDIARMTSILQTGGLPVRTLCEIASNGRDLASTPRIAETASSTPNNQVVREHDVDYHSGIRNTDQPGDDSFVRAPAKEIAAAINPPVQLTTAIGVSEIKTNVPETPPKIVHRYYRVTPSDNSGQSSNSSQSAAFIARSVDPISPALAGATVPSAHIPPREIFEENAQSDSRLPPPVEPKPELNPNPRGPRNRPTVGVRHIPQPVMSLAVNVTSEAPIAVRDVSYAVTPTNAVQDYKVADHSRKSPSEPQPTKLPKQHFRDPDTHDISRVQPVGGDIFFDGASLGRWLSRTLTREAERSSAGRTGFDARRGRLMPGSTVGGT